MSNDLESFDSLNEVATHLREKLEGKKYFLMYGYNGTGKTRLSMEFKELGKTGDERDTLYFNAFTEDLFYWDNDLDNDTERVMRVNHDSHFFDGLQELEMENRIRPLLQRYADFDFVVDYENWEINFYRIDYSVSPAERIDHIKVSRGEENIFIWCFFLAIMQLVCDGDETYEWVKYVYIDDPISSLDENNAVAVANHLVQLLTQSDNSPMTVISSHHVLFYNVLCNELRNKAYRYFLKRGTNPNSYILQSTSSKPFLHHLATLVDLHEVQSSGALYTHHFNMMRRVMEQTASFFGMQDWKECIKVEEDDPDKTLYKRIIDLMSHGDYSIYEPREMMEENKEHFRKIFKQFITSHPFNPALFPEQPEETAA